MSTWALPPSGFSYDGSVDDGTAVTNTFDQAFEDGCEIIPGNPSIGFTRCYIPTDYTNGWGWDLAAAAAAVDAQAASFGEPVPDYYAFTFGVEAGSPGYGTYGCRRLGDSEDMDTVDGCAVLNRGASSSRLQVTGATGSWHPDSGGFFPSASTTPVPITDITGEQAPDPSDPQRGNDYSLSFHGWVINPAPDGTLDIPDAAGSYSGNLLFTAAEVPGGITVVYDCGGAHCPTLYITARAIGVHDNRTVTPTTTQAVMCIL